MRVLFLNVDVIMVPLGSMSTAAEAVQWLYELARDLSTHGDVQVLLYGAFEETYPPLSQETLVRAFGHHLVGVAESAKPLNGIEAYLRQHSEVTDFVVLDSFATHFDESLNRHLIPTDPGLGLKDWGARNLRDWLTGTPRPRGDFAIADSMQAQELAQPTAPRLVRNERVTAVVTLLIPEFELVHLTAPGDVTLAIGEGTPGVAWQDLRLGQQLECLLEGEHYSRVVWARVLQASPAADAQKDEDSIE